MDLVGRGRSPETAMAWHRQTYEAHEACSWSEMLVIEKVGMRFELTGRFVISSFSFFHVDPQQGNKRKEEGSGAKPFQ